MTEPINPPEFTHNFPDLISREERTITVGVIPTPGKVALWISQPGGNPLCLVWENPSEGNHLLTHSPVEEDSGSVANFRDLCTTMGLSATTMNQIQRQAEDAHSWIEAHPLPANVAKSSRQYFEGVCESRDALREARLSGLSDSILLLEGETIDEAFERVDREYKRTLKILKSLAEEFNDDDF